MVLTARSGLRVGLGFGLVFGLAIGFFVGWMVGPGQHQDQSGHSTREPRPPGDPAATTGDRQSSPPSIVNAGDVESRSLRARIADLEAEVASLEGALSALEDVAYGTPVPWPEEVPIAHRPEEFERMVSEAFEECQVEGMDLLGFDCSGAPCFASVRVPGVSFVHEEAGYAMAELEACEAWDPQFGRPETEYIAPVQCPDGSTEYLMLLRSGVPLPMGQGGVHLFEEMANIQHRWKLRADAIKDGWQCVGEGRAE